MKLSYRLATISYCPDLTDPGAASIPIAVLAVGKSDEHWSAAAVNLDAKRLGLDPLSSALLGDVPHLIRRHVDAAMKRMDASATPATVLTAFHESLKTSIHVSELSEVREVELADAFHISEALFKASLMVLERAIQRLAQQAAGPRLRSAWMPQVAPERLMQPPEQAFWQPMMPLQAATT